MYISYTKRITFQKDSKMHSPKGQRNMNDMAMAMSQKLSPNLVSKVQNCMWP